MPAQITPVAISVTERRKGRRERKEMVFVRTSWWSVRELIFFYSGERARFSAFLCSIAMCTPWHVRVANLVKENIPKFRDWHCWGWDTSHRLKIPRILLFANLHSVRAYIRKDWPWKNVPASYVVLAVLWKYGTYTCFVRTWWNGENLALKDRIIFGHIKLHMPLFRYNIITLV